MDYSHIESQRVPRRATGGSVVRKASVEVAALAIVFFFATPCIPQGQRPAASLGDGQVRATLGDFGSPDPVLTKRQMRLLNVERQKELVSDADKLLVLAKQLSAEVSAADSGALSFEQMREVDQIEKLAKSVKSKMELTIGGNAVSPAEMVP